MVISADEHLVEPVEFWEGVLPDALGPADRDRAPRLDGPMLVVDGQVVPTFALFPDLAARSDTQPGGGDAAGRLAVMDAEGIDAAVLFPQRTMGMFAMADPELLVRCVTVYNEWLADLCGRSDGRLHGVAVLPTVRRPEATSEYLDHLGALGFRLVMLPGRTRGAGYADPSYEPMWAALEAHQLVVAFHTSEAPDDNGPGGLGTYLAVQFQPFRKLWAYLVFTGLLERHPGLRVLFAEGGISWIPSALDHADRIHRIYGGDLTPRLPEEPSAYWWRQCWATFMEDPTGLEQLDRIGADRILWSSDYPHPEGTFGRTAAVLGELEDRLGKTRAAAVTDGTARQLLGLAAG
jgi:predicted TIM-barrel fold metal-dependent hydrolase